MGEKPPPTREGVRDSEGWRVSGGYGSGSRGAVETPVSLELTTRVGGGGDVSVSTANLLSGRLGLFDS